MSAHALLVAVASELDSAVFADAALERFDREMHPSCVGKKWVNIGPQPGSTSRSNLQQFSALQVSNNSITANQQPEHA